MKHPLPKRRRVSSNPLAPFSSSGSFNASPKPSRLTTCTSCHRTLGLKSSPTFLCARCSASSCAICLRTCTSDSATTTRSPCSLNLPLDSIAVPFSQSNKNIPSLRQRRPRDDDNDNMLKTKEVDDGRTGCGQVVCRTCCFEDPQSGIVACLDCSAKQRALQTHDSDNSMHGTLTSDHNLIASS